MRSLLAAEGTILLELNGSETGVPCDHIVWAVGATQNLDMVKELDDAGISCIRIGDCAGDIVGMLGDAVRQAWEEAVRV